MQGICSRELFLYVINGPLDPLGLYTEGLDILTIEIKHFGMFPIIICTTSREVHLTCPLLVPVFVTDYS